MVPTHVCSNVLLWNMARARPDTVPKLDMCEGASAAFQATYGQV